MEVVTVGIQLFQWKGRYPQGRGQNVCYSSCDHLKKISEVVSVPHPFHFQPCGMHDGKDLRGMAEFLPAEGSPLSQSLSASSGIHGFKRDMYPGSSKLALAGYPNLQGCQHLPLPGHSFASCHSGLSEGLTSGPP
ncbi:hypothetical protein Y1Q_0012589 [Alligator mississippiensis]|uniref:Uncharacterized protein n=1 Tax=Alligator mississippiensis TaxID=8496 RepID=A0A151M883_ALLMI|nr:hypothetical protein Y1Q_0012589 [Alligator mississippiensis]